ncbi:unnamed protein product [marine sediment metagenome]|uniref:Uncharacterized protein n=1 Tax=marine sediment metagenome TaxID=412755 RepID=X1IZK9_9ZZZZ
MDLHDQVKQHAKEMGMEDVLDSLIEEQKPERYETKSTTAELRYRKKRDRKKKLSKLSKRRNVNK